MNSSNLKANLYEFFKGRCDGTFSSTEPADWSLELTPEANENHNVSVESFMNELVEHLLVSFTELKQSKNDALTRYIVQQAFSMCQEQGGELFARQMVLEAGISSSNTHECNVVAQMGEQYLEFLKSIS